MMDEKLSQVDTPHGPAVEYLGDIYETSPAMREPFHHARSLIREGLSRDANEFVRSLVQSGDSPGNVGAVQVFLGNCLLVEDRLDKAEDHYWESVKLGVRKSSRARTSYPVGFSRKKRVNDFLRRPSR